MPNLNIDNKKFVIGAAIIVVLLVMVYMSYWPMPVYESVIGNPEAEDKLMSDENEAQRINQELIQKTKDAYAQRVTELSDAITDPDGEISQAAEEYCQGELWKYGDGAVYGGMNWVFNGDTGTTQMSDAEAERLLYKYTALYDLDLTETNEDSYMRWLFGSEEDGIDYFKLEAFDKTFDIETAKGSYLDEKTLDAARAKAYREAKQAYLDYYIDKAQTTLLHIFIPTAYAESGNMLSEGYQSPNEAYEAAYNAVMEEAYAAYGSSALNQGVLTNIFDTNIQGCWSFSLIQDGEAQTMNLEEYMQGCQLKDEVDKYNENPLLGQAKITYNVESSGQTYGWTVKGADGLDHKEYAEETDYVTTITVQFYKLTHTVAFTIPVEQNASGA